MCAKKTTSLAKSTTKRTKKTSAAATKKAKAIKINVKKNAPVKLQPKTKLGSLKLPVQIVPKLYKKIIIASILFILILAVLVIHYSFSMAHITISPEYSEHDISFSAQIVDPVSLAS